MESLNDLQREINEEGTATVFVTLPVHILEALRSAPPTLEALQYATNAVVQEANALPQQLFDHAIAVEVWRGDATQSYEELQYAMQIPARGSTTLRQLITWLEQAVPYITQAKHKMLWAWGEGEVDLFAAGRPKLSTTLKQMGIGEEMHVSLIEKVDHAHILEQLEKMGVGESEASRERQNGDDEAK